MVLHPRFVVAANVKHFCAVGHASDRGRESLFEGSMYSGWSAGVWRASTTRDRQQTVFFNPNFTEIGTSDFEMDCVFMGISNLGDHAVKLAKTPLGIIALFVLFAEAIAALVVSTTSNLSDTNQLIMVLFITFFPTLVVGMFWHLLVHHNVKLYAPSEYPNHADFIEANRVDPTVLLREFKKDIIDEVEKTTAATKTKVARGNIEIQASEFVSAVRLIEELKLSKAEISVLAEIKDKEVSLEKAEELYGGETVAKFKKLDLVKVTGVGGAAAMLTEVAKTIVRLM